MRLGIILSKLFRSDKYIKLTGWTIKVLNKIYGSKDLEYKLECLRTFPKGTVGREVAEMLYKKNYGLIPKFENHDLKHIILDYDMTMKDEIRMQAYLVGNGNYTWPCLIFLSLGLFYPTIWKDLPNEFIHGKRAKTIHFLTLDNCMDKSLIEIKEMYGRKKKTAANMGFSAMLA